MKPEAPPEPSTPTTPGPRLWSSQPRPCPLVPRDGATRAMRPSTGHIDRAAESWTDRELTECLRRNLD